MTIGRPGSPGTPSVLRQRLLGMGLADDQVVSLPLAPPSRLGPGHLQPEHFLPDAGPFVHRVERLLGGGRGLSIYVTGGRSEAAARQYAALQIALGVAATGRQVVLADADFLRPGLGGLLSDPLAEGLTDMARFGRSAQSLFLHPLPEGPWLLPASSFPEDDPAPLALEALRSVVYRVSQTCDLALYIGPLQLRNEIHPLARVCDHVVYAGLEDWDGGGATCAEAVHQMQAQGTHPIGVLTFAAPAQFVEAGRERARPEAPAVPPRGRQPAAPTGAPPIEPPLPEWRQRPEPAPALPEFLRPTSEPRPVPAPTAGPQPPPAAWPAPPAAARQPPVARPEPAVEPLAPRVEPESRPKGEPAIVLPTPPRIDLNARPPAAERPPAWQLPPLDFPELPETPEPEPEPTEMAETGEREQRAFAARIAPRGPIEERDRAGRRSSEPSGEFSFEEERGGHGSALLIIAIIVVTVSFLVVLGPRLVERWRESREPATEETTSPATGGQAPESPAPAGPESPPTQPPAGSTELGTRPATTPSSTPQNAAAPGGAETGTSTTRPAPSPAEPDDRAAATGAVQSGATPDDRAAAQEPVRTPPQQSAAPPPVKETPQPERAKPAAPAGTGWVVHLSSYRTEKTAKVEIAGLRRHGYQGGHELTDLGEKGMWYRVYAGPFATREEAEKARVALLKFPEYHYAQVRRESRD